MKIITLTLNPAIDVHCRGEKFVPFSENLFKITSKDAGGKGINVSKALNAFGVETENILLIGKENGNEFLRMLDEEKISHKEIFTDGAIRENITLHSKEGETRVSFEGFSADDEVLKKLKELIFENELKDSFIVMAGRLPSGISLEKVKSLLKELKKGGAKIVIDSKSFKKEDILEVAPYLIKPNEEEIFEYSDISDLTIDSVGKAASYLRRKGIDNVLVSLGKNGAYLSGEEGEFYTKAPEIKAVSTIGAGDSVIAGFIFGIVKGLSKEEAFKRGVAFGSAACLKDGTKAPDKEDIEKLLNEITIIKG